MLLKFSSAFPWGIFIANILGCFLIGLIGAFVELKFTLNPNLVALIFTGFLGGLTTFSTFSYDTFNLFREGHLGYALINAASQVVLGLLAVWIGYRIMMLFIHY